MVLLCCVLKKKITRDNTQFIDPLPCIDLNIACVCGVAARKTRQSLPPQKKSSHEQQQTMVRRYSSPSVHRRSIRRRSIKRRSSSRRDKKRAICSKGSRRCNTRRYRSAQLQVDVCRHEQGCNPTCSIKAVLNFLSNHHHLKSDPRAQHAVKAYNDFTKEQAIQKWKRSHPFFIFNHIADEHLNTEYAILEKKSVSSTQEIVHSVEHCEGGFLIVENVNEEVAHSLAIVKNGEPDKFIILNSWADATAPHEFPNIQLLSEFANNPNSYNSLSTVLQTRNFIAYVYQVKRIKARPSVSNTLKRRATMMYKPTR